MLFKVYLVTLSGQELVQYIQRFRSAGWPMPWWHLQIPDFPQEKKDLLPDITFTLAGDIAHMYMTNIKLEGTNMKNFRPVVLQLNDWETLTQLIRDSLGVLRTGTSGEHLEHILGEIEDQSASPSRELCELALKLEGK